MSLKSLIRSLARSGTKLPYQPLITVSISRSALLHNLDEFKKLTNRPIAPVLKSNAYGHGLIEVAKIVEETKPPFIVVDSLFEATALRSKGIKSNILVIGYTRAEDVVMNKLRDVFFTITSLQALITLSEKLILHGLRDVTIQLKIDTGMRRQGILTDEIDQAISLIKNNSSLQLNGVCSHFADADSAGSEYTGTQIRLWNEIVAKLKKNKDELPDLEYFHVSNSAGHAFEGSIDATVSRLGIGLYGIDSSSTLLNRISQRPVLSVTTLVSSIKTIPARQAVGYNGTFTSTKPMTLGTIPMGYFEGLDRRLSNKGFVLVKGVMCPIVGRISMNIATIDLSEVKGVILDEPVEVIGRVTERQNSIPEIARICETIPYDIAVHVGSHLRRIVVD